MKKSSLGKWPMRLQNSLLGFQPCLLLLVVMMLFPIRIWSQDAAFMKTVMAEKDDSVRIATLLNKASEIKYSAPKESAVYARMGLREAEKQQQYTLMARAYNLIGTCHEKMSDLDSSVYYYEKAIALSRKHNNIKGLASAYNNLGLNYHLRLQEEKALSYFIESEKYFLELKDDKNIAKLYSNIGMVKANLRDSASAIEYYSRALERFTKLEDNFGIGSVYNNLSDFYYKYNDFSKARQYLLKSLGYHRKAEDKFGLSNVLVNLGTLEYEMKDFPSSKQYLAQSLTLKREIDDRIGMAKIFLYQAKNAKEAGNNSTYKASLDSALYYADAQDSPEDVAELYKEFSAYYEQNQDFKSSIDYYKKYAELYVKIYNDSNAYRVNELNVKYDTQKRENKILLQEKGLRARKTALLSVILGTVLLGGLAYSIYRRRILKQKNELNEKMLELQAEHTQAVFAAEERERKAIADHLHDSTGQILCVAKMKADIFEQIYKIDHPKQLRDLEEIKGFIDSACDEIRTVSHQLKSMELERMGLMGALKNLMRQIRTPRLDTGFEISGTMPNLKASDEIVVYRVAQEAIKNAITHGSATRIKTQIDSQPGKVCIRITDDGRGFDTSSSSNGIGLQNMRDRIGFLKGDIRFISAKGQGTTVEISLPV